MTWRPVILPDRPENIGAYVREHHPGIDPSDWYWMPHGDGVRLMFREVGGDE